MAVAAGPIYIDHRMKELVMGHAYDAAMLAFQKHLRRTDEGYFHLDAENGQEIGISDPVIFADLKRSLDETNRKIKLGQINPWDIKLYAA